MPAGGTSACYHWQRLSLTKPSQHLWASLLWTMDLSLPHLCSLVIARILSQFRNIPPHPWFWSPSISNQIPHAHARHLISLVCPQQEPGLVSLVRIPYSQCLLAVCHLPTPRPLFLGCKSPAVFTALGTEPNSTLGSLFPCWKGFWIKSFSNQSLSLTRRKSVLLLSDTSQKPGWWVGFDKAF